MIALLVYPNFHMGVHGYDNPDPMKSAVSNDWCRYAVIDPGHSVCAVLFAAVPPEDNMVLIYDELYIRGSNASIFAEQFAKKTVGRAFMLSLLMLTAVVLLTSEVARHLSNNTLRNEQERVRSEVTGSSFIPGSDNIQAGIQSVHMAMHIQGSGKSRLRVLRGACLILSVRFVGTRKRPCR